MTSLRFRAATAFLALAAFTAPVRAQTFRVIPQVGVFVNARDLPAPDIQLFLRDRSDRSSKLALGLAVETELSGLPLGARVGALYGAESDVPVRGVVCIEAPCRSVRAGTFALTGDLLLDLPSPGGLRPFLLGGVGLERWSVDHEVGVGSFVESETRFAGHLGAGAELGLGSAGLRLELDDYITGGADEDGPSIGGPQARHDLFVMLGVSLTW